MVCRCIIEKGRQVHDLLLNAKLICLFQRNLINRSILSDNLINVNIIPILLSKEI